MLKTIDGDASYKKRLELAAGKFLELVIADPAIRKLCGRSRTKLVHAIKHILHTAAYVASDPSSWQAMSLSLNANDYRPGGSFPDHSYTCIKAVIDALTLERDGNILPWLIMRAGTYNPDPSKRVRSRFTIQPDMADWMIQQGLVFANHPYGAGKAKKVDAPLLRVKQGDDHHALNRPVAPQEACLIGLNDLLAKSRIELHLPSYALYKDHWNWKESRSGIPRPTMSFLYRCFSDADGMGGRIFGSWVQNMPSPLRRYLTINGQETIEMDYRAMQPCMAYSRIGRSLDGDAYLIPGYSPRYREAFKALFSKSVGTETPKSTLKSFRGELLNSSDFKARNAAVLSDAFWGHHREIADLNGSSAWKWLQMMESEVALSVIGKLVDQGICVIPIHDSFIVQARHADVLYKAMYDAITEQGYSCRPEIVTKG